MTTATKDLIEVIYWFISIIVLFFTAIYVANASVRAVR